MPFAVLMVWTEQKAHLTDCYFCLTKIEAHNSKSKRTIIYPNIPDDSPPIPKPPQQLTLHEEEPSSTSPIEDSGSSCSNVDHNFSELTAPHLISQSEVNDLVRDINLYKHQAELSTPRLHG